MVKLGVTPGGGGAAGVLLGSIAKIPKTEALVSAVAGDEHDAEIPPAYIGRVFYELQCPWSPWSDKSISLVCTMNSVQEVTYQ